MANKICNICKKEKEIADFGTYRQRNKVYTRNHCKKCISLKGRTYKEQNLDRVKENQAQFRERHKVRLRKKYKSWRNNRKEPGVNARYSKEYQKRNRLAFNLRQRLRHALKGRAKVGSAVRDLGCSIEELKIHLEHQFQSGMTWDNYGEWQIDHIIPLSRVDLTDKAQFKQVCYYTNLQPLWKIDNCRKGNKIPR